MQVPIQRSPRFDRPPLKLATMLPLDEFLETFRSTDTSNMSRPEKIEQIKKEVLFIWHLILLYQNCGVTPYPDDGVNTYAAKMNDRDFIDNSNDPPSVAVWCLIFFDNTFIRQDERTVEKDLAELKRLAMKYTVLIVNK